MIEKVTLPASPDADLLLAFVIRASREVADDILADVVHIDMQGRLKEARQNGRGGWNTASVTNADLEKRILKNIESGDWMDVINLSAMRYVRGKIFEEVHLKREVEQCQR